MQGIAQANWAILKEKFGIEMPEGYSPDKERIEVFPSREGFPTVRVKGANGRPLLLHSAVNPVREAQRLAENRQFKPGSFIVIQGFGMGYLPEALLHKVDERSFIFVVEPDPDIFYAAMEARDLRHILNAANFLLTVSDDVKAAKKGFSATYDAEKYDGIEYVTLPGYEVVFAEYFAKFAELAKNAVSEQFVALTTAIGIGAHCTINAFSNLLKYADRPGVCNLYDRFPGVPAIIVAAGPSLDKNIQLLHEAKGKALIIAVGTAVKALKKQGIEPDFIYSLDPIPLSYEHLRDIDTSKSCLIADLNAFHMVWENFQGEIFAVGIHPILKWFDKLIEEKGYIPSAGSVANNGLVLAYKMGADPIILIGQDLAYSRDGRSHAKGTTYENDIYEENTEGHFYIKANDGGEIRTDRLLYQYLRFFQDWFTTNADRKYINATEGGAFIEGSEVSTLREVIDQYCSNQVDVQAVIREIQDSFKKPSIKSVKKILAKRLKEAQAIINMSEKALKHLQELQAACEEGCSQKISKYMAFVKKIFTKWKAEKNIVVIAETFLRHDIHIVMHRTYRAGYSEDDDINKAIHDYKMYYERVREATRAVKELIENVLDKVKNRIEGENERV